MAAPTRSRTWAPVHVPRSDKKSGTYILPLKKQVRQELDLTEGSRITVSLRIVG